MASLRQKGLIGPSAIREHGRTKNHPLQIFSFSISSFKPKLNYMQSATPINIVYKEIR